MESASKVFERLVAAALTAHGFTLRDPAQVAPNVDVGFDYIGERHGDYWAIEAKYYRTIRPQASLLEVAAVRLASRAPRFQAKRGLLVISSLVTEDIRNHLQTKFGITVIDRDDLLTMVSDSPQLFDEMAALLEADPKLVTPSFPRRYMFESGDRQITATPGHEDRHGSHLCQELRGLRRGRKTWPQFEKLGERILKYLFPKDLLGWHPQKSTDGGLGRYDCVCRIRPTTDFWNFVTQHLDSRYVVFEYKNYSEKIKQGQILTTEKYLLERGLRRVAIVLSRAGLDANAMKLAKGAMREGGKLILVIGDDDLCKMLHLKEQGADPSDYLFELTDDFLLDLGR